MSLRQSPYLLYSDGCGNIFEDTSLYAAGRAAWDVFPIPKEDWIMLPDGGNLYELPGRRGIGIDVNTGEMRLCEKGWAVAAFIPPAHTGLYLSAYEVVDNHAPTLPLFCYTAAGWLNNQFYVSALRIEKDIRQECSGYNDKKIAKGAAQLLKNYPQNRLIKHLVENCCNTYQCPAARNLALSRWECPVPVSPACNANCIGCISWQSDEDVVPATQDRLCFQPLPEEIVEFTVPHLLQAPFPIISFGQGCEGEPLLMWKAIRDAIIEMRKHTQNGCINLNTNGSNPKAVKALCQAGLDSIRVSLNSAQKHIYTRYYRPNNYEFEDIVESLKMVRSFDKWASINYFVFPGMTDTETEYESLCKLIKETDLNMIQWRNFNIDPDWYLGEMNITETPEIMGIRQFMNLIQEEFPQVKFGYYNPSIERIKGNYEKDFAH